MDMSPRPDGLPLPRVRDATEVAIADLVASGIGLQRGFLDEETRLALLHRVLEQAQLEREQGVAEVSPTGTASEMRFSQEGDGVLPFQAVSFLPNKGRVFIDVLADTRFATISDAVFGGVPWYVAQQTATIVRKGAAGQVIHTDQQAWPFLTPRPVMFNAVLCLTDFEPDMGSTRFVPQSPGTHPPRIARNERTGLVGNVDALEPQAIALPAGSLAMWDGNVWHGQGASVSSRDRVGIIITFVMHMVRAQDDYVAMLHDDVYVSLDDHERRLLGFEVHYEYAGRVSPRNSADRRSNTNFNYPFVPELRRGNGARAVPAGSLRIAHPDLQAARI